ncbi:MAG: hypothetical protein ACYC1B_06995, partial [Thermoleophilia bacterium]
DEGWWFYLHTVAVNDYPFPYHAEFFAIEDDSIVGDWKMKWELEEGNLRLVRIAPEIWAHDDTFYERLIDGDPVAIAQYHCLKR